MEALSEFEKAPHRGQPPGNRRFGIAGLVQRGDVFSQVEGADLAGRNGALAAIEKVRQVGLAAADFLQRPRHVAVPLHGVHADVEMAVEDQHGGFQIWDL